METLQQYHETAAIFLARLFLGLLFFFQGYDAVFKVRIRNIIETYQNALSRKNVPAFLIVCGAWFTSLTELIGGTLLILGLFEYAALYLLALNLLVACIGFALDTPMWDTRHALPRLILLLFLMLVPTGTDLWSLDYLFKP